MLIENVPLEMCSNPKSATKHHKHWTAEKPGPKCTCTHKTYTHTCNVNVLD